MNVHEQIVAGGCTNPDRKLGKPRTTRVGVLFSWIRRLVRWTPSGPKSK